MHHFRLIQKERNAKSEVEGEGDSQCQGSELEDVGRRHAGDLAERFAGEKSLVRGDEHVGKIEQQ